MNEVKPMKIKEVVKRLRHQQSIKAIHRETGVHRQTIRAIRQIADDAGWLDVNRTMPDESEIAKRYKSYSRSNKQHPLDSFKEEISLWVKAGYSFTVMHQMLLKRVICSESAVRRYVKSRFPKILNPVMVRPTIPGEAMDVDLGFLGQVIDSEKNTHRAWFFSARLRHSRRAYREVLISQRQEHFFEAHVHAFGHFNGVPRKVVIDNLKAGVIRSTIDNERLNKTYCDLAEHYDFMISPCLVRTPEHKGGVENDVKYVKKNFWPRFVEEQRSMGRSIPRLDDLQAALDRWNQEVADVRTIGQVGRSPIEIFDAEECAKLTPLPAKRWNPVKWSKAIVSKEWRVRFENAFYSVPYQYLGKTVWICANLKFVRIFCDYEEIACHEKATEEWQYRRKKEHAPLEQETVLSSTRIGLATWAESIGPCTHEVVSRMLGNRKIDKLRPARLVLQLSCRYSGKRLERACQRALYYETLSYACVKRILEEKLDKEPLEEEVKQSEDVECYRFARHPSEYAN